MSSDIIVVIGAITTTTAFSKSLKKLYKIQAKIVHTPSFISSDGGCSYSVLTNKKYIDQIRSISEKSGIKIKGIYQLEIHGEKEVYHDIS